jgi:Amiloride-sensitive sodium channel
MLRKEFDHFCDNATLHGFAYISQTKRTLAEKYGELTLLRLLSSSSTFSCRIFWLLAIAISFVSTGVLIAKFFDHIKKNPIAIYSTEKDVLVTNLNFPAVSMCFGVILSTDQQTLLDYDGIMTSLMGNEISLGNLTPNELRETISELT